MTYPYHLAVHGVFFEAAKDGGVAIIRKAESRLASRTMVRIELTAEQWAEAIAAMKKAHDDKGTGKPSVFGPMSKQGSAPDMLPAADSVSKGQKGYATSKAAAGKVAVDKVASTPAANVAPKPEVDRVGIAQARKRH